jgi:histidyl-tRNA synthetase
VLQRAGYREIRTPVFEDTSLFERSIGEATDVVGKEMFTVARGDSSVSFRPEGTAGVVRAYLEHHLDKVRPFQKLFYMGPMFRYERPQAGRQRQFDQIGIEALGSASPMLDAEVVQLGMQCYQALGLQNFQLAINTLGDAQDRARYREALRAHFAPLLDERCADCRARFEKNPLRMLDCKQKGCQPGNQSAPKMVDTLSDSSRQRFKTTLGLLRKLGIAYEVDSTIVRGLDYYTHTVFEIRCPDVGARSAICGGGRYDGLIAALGGPDLGAVGFAIGVVPLLVALEKQGNAAVQPREPDVDVFVVPVSEAEREAAFLLAHELRAAGLSADTDYEDRSLKALFKQADKRGVKFTVVVGPDEVAQMSAKVKDMRAGSESTVPRAQLAAELARRLAS